MQYLSPDTLQRLHRLALELGLCDARPTLLSGIPAPIVANLRSVSNPSEQLLLDLQALNQLPSREPLHQWLNNVLTLHGHDERSAAFRKALNATAPSLPKRPIWLIASLAALPFCVAAMQFCVCSKQEAPPKGPTESASVSLDAAPLASSVQASPESQTSELKPSPQTPESKPSARAASSAGSADSVKISNEVKDIKNEGDMEAGNVEAKSKPGGTLIIENKVEGVTGSKGSTTKVGNVKVE